MADYSFNPEGSEHDPAYHNNWQKVADGLRGMDIEPYHPAVNLLTQGYNYYLKRLSYTEANVNRAARGSGLFQRGQAKQEALQSEQGELDRLSSQLLTALRDIGVPADTAEEAVRATGELARQEYNTNINDNAVHVSQLDMLSPQAVISEMHYQARVHEPSQAIGTPDDAQAGLEKGRSVIPPSGDRNSFRSR